MVSMTYWVKALKMYITEIPARIIIAGLHFFIAASIRITAAGSMRI